MTKKNITIASILLLILLIAIGIGLGTGKVNIRLATVKPLRESVLALSGSLNPVVLGETLVGENVLVDKLPLSVAYNLSLQANLAGAENNLAALSQPYAKLGLLV